MFGGATKRDLQIHCDKNAFQTLFYPDVTLNERKVDVTYWSKYYDSGTDFHSLFNICFNMLALGKKELCNAVKYTTELFQAPPILTKQPPNTEILSSRCHF